MLLRNEKHQGNYYPGAYLHIGIGVRSGVHLTRSRRMDECGRRL